MSCETSANKAVRAARQSGLSPAGSKSGFTAASTAQVSFFALAGSQAEADRPPRSKRSQEAGNPNGRGAAQVSFFRQAQAAARPEEQQAQAGTGKLPNRRQIYLKQEFTTEELDRLAVQLHLSAAATRRHLHELGAGRSRGIGHGDPRPLDWAQLDQQQYGFLTEQLRRARRGDGYIDTGPLKKKELVQLWEFARFEADRAHRNIDHLTSGLSHIKGPAADYLAGGHKLEARFYNFLAGQLETIIPPEALVREAW